MKKRITRKKQPLRFRYSEAYRTLIAHEDELRGKYVVIVGRKIFAADTGEEASEILAQVRQEFPKKTPLATFLPKAETLILCL